MMSGVAIVGLFYRPEPRVLKRVGWVSIFLFPVYPVNTCVQFLYNE